MNAEGDEIEDGRSTMEDRMSAHGALAVMRNSLSSILYSLSPSLRLSRLRLLSVLALFSPHIFGAGPG